MENPDDEAVRKAEKRFHIGSAELLYSDGQFYMAARSIHKPSTVNPDEKVYLVVASRHRLITRPLQGGNRPPPVDLPHRRGRSFSAPLARQVITGRRSTKAQQYGIRQSRWLLPRMRRAASGERVPCRVRSPGAGRTGLLGAEDRWACGSWWSTITVCSPRHSPRR